jgi:hypothetical protein
VLQAALVEAFRLLAQLLTWSDQHEPALFDFFVEQRVRSRRLRGLARSCARDVLP